MFIKDYSETINKWKNCPMANYVCPVAKYTKLETNTPRGLAFVLSLVLNNKKEYDKEVIEKIYQCDLCRACEAIRRDDSSIPDAVISARRDIIKIKKVPHKVENLKKDIIEYSNIFNTDFLKEKIKESKLSEYVFIIHDSESADNTKNSIDKVLNKNKKKYSFISMGKYPAPASLLYELGYHEESAKAVDNILYLLKELKVASVVFLVPNDLELTRKKMDIENAIHSFIFLEDLVKRIPLKLKEKILYFDFTTGREKEEFYSIPREIMNSISSLIVKEMMWEGKESISCGGLNLRYTYPDILEGIIRKIIEEIEEYDINTVVTPCINCIDNFKSVDTFNKKFEIFDLWKLTEKALKNSGKT